MDIKKTNKYHIFCFLDIAHIPNSKPSLPSFKNFFQSVLNQNSKIAPKNNFYLTSLYKSLHQKDHMEAQIRGIPMKV